MGPHVIERLSAYMDGELGEPERAAVGAHLQGCPSCARHLAELQAVDAAARGLPLAVPDGYFEAFRDRLRHRLAPVRPARRLLPWWVGAAAAALVLALLTPRALREPRTPLSPAAPVPTLADRAARNEAASPPPAAAEQERSPLASRRPRAREAEKPAAEAPEPPPSTPAAAAPAAAKKAAPDEGYAAAPAQADRVEETPRASARMENTAAARRDEGKERRAKATPGMVATEDHAADSAPALSAARFQLLLGRTVSSAAQARALREAWRAFARDEAAGPRADEARVRAIEAGAEAWRRGKDEADRVQAQKEAREYLDRTDALQAERVRGVLRSLSP